MNTNRRTFAALIGAGLLWGTTVPLSKLALHWLPPGWLTFVRFAVAAAILLPAARHQLRAAFRPAVLASGAAGYGGSVLLQNAGITRTSVTHAALLIGAVPVMVAVIAAVWQRAVARPVAWAGFALALAGVGLVTGGHGGGASTAGDALVLVSLLVSAIFTVAQTRLLAGHDPVATTAVQFLGAALAVLPFAALTEGLLPSPAPPGPSWPPPPWRPAARCCRSPCSLTRRAGCPPRWRGRSSTSSRSSAPRRARCSSATRSGRASSPGARRCSPGLR